MGGLLKRLISIYILRGKSRFLERTLTTVFLLNEPSGSSFFGGFKIRVILEDGLYWKSFYFINLVIFQP